MKLKWIWGVFLSVGVLLLALSGTAGAKMEMSVITAPFGKGSYVLGICFGADIQKILQEYSDHFFRVAGFGL